MMKMRYNTFSSNFMMVLILIAIATMKKEPLKSDIRCGEIGLGFSAKKSINRIFSPSPPRLGKADKYKLG